MRVKDNRRQRELGAAALEFALTVPLFLAVLAATVYFGLALYTKFVMINAANAAVRACVSKQVGFTSNAQFTSCASAAFSDLMKAPAYNNLCGSASVVPAPGSLPLSFDRLRDDVALLTLEITCAIPIGGMINGMVNVASPGATPADTQIPLKIFSAMPYTKKLR